MAASLVDSGNHLHRTSAIVSGASAFTAMFWYLPVAGTLTSGVPWVTAHGTPGTAGYTTYAALLNSGGAYDVEVSDGTTIDDIFYGIQNVTAGIWKHICYTRTAGGIHNFYVNGLVVLSAQSLSLAAAVLNFILLGDDGSADGNTQVFSNYREWSVALTPAQIRQELASTGAVVNGANLVAFTPLTSNANDVSGNGNNWTTVGTVTYVADPVFPANFSPNTATVIPALPDTHTDALQVTAGQAASGFFTYAPTPTDVAISAFPFGVLGAFAPLVAAFRPDGTPLNAGRDNLPLFFAIVAGTVGQPYLLEVVPDGTLTTPTATLTTSSYPQGPSPIGSLAIPTTGTFADGTPVPLALLAPASSAVSSMVPGFPAGGLGSAPGVGLATILPNGVLLITVGPTGLQVYDGGYHLLGMATAPGTITAICNDNIGTFYVSYTVGGHTLVKALSQTGVLGATTYDLGVGTFKAVGTDVPGTALYYQVATGIDKWDLVNNVSLGALIVGVTFHTPTIGLGDGSLIIGSDITTFTHYSGAGAIISQFTNANGQNFAGSDVLAPGVDPTTFFQWQTNLGAQATVVYSLTTGLPVANVPRTVFAGAVSSGSPSATPVLYGPDPTCPVWVTRTPFPFTPPPPPPPPSPPSTTLVLDMRVLGSTTRWLPDAYRPSVKCRNWEPGTQVHDAVLGHVDGSVSIAGGHADQGAPIPYAIQVPDFTAEDPRRWKTFGDLVLDLDPQNSVGITLQPAGNNFTQPLTPSVWGTGITGRTLFTVDLLSGLGYLARSLGIRISGADLVAPVFYLWEPSYIPKVEQTILRATDWDDASYFGAKFVQGLLLEVDTVNEPRALQVEYDQGQVSEIFTVNPGGLQSQVPYSFLQPLVGAHLLRLVALNEELWRFYRLRWVWEPMPEAVSVWQTQPTTLDLPGYSQEERILIAHMSTSDFTVTVTADGVSQTYPVANSGGLFVKTEILEAPNKGKVYTFRAATVDGSQSLRIFMKDLEVRHRAWGGGAYEGLRPFGDVSREHGGARI